MGLGIELAGLDNPEHAKLLDDFKDQLLIVLLKRLDGKVSIPLAEADDTSQDILLMAFSNDEFTFTLKKKN